MVTVAGAVRDPPSLRWYIGWGVSARPVRPDHGKLVRLCEVVATEQHRTTDAERALEVPEERPSDLFFPLFTWLVFVFEMFRKMECSLLPLVATFPKFPYPSARCQPMLPSDRLRIFQPQPAICACACVFEAASCYATTPQSVWNSCESWRCKINVKQM